MRWMIFFLLVANVALFFWLQQQSRPAPGSSVLPPPDVGTLRLRHEQHRRQASATDQVATEVPVSDAATSGESMAELQHVEQIPRVSQSSAGDEAVDVERLPEQPVPLVANGSQRSGEPAGQTGQVPERQDRPAEPSVPASAGLTPTAAEPVSRVAIGRVSRAVASAANRLDRAVVARGSRTGRPGAAGIGRTNRVFALCVDRVDRPST